MNEVLGAMAYVSRRAHGLTDEQIIDAIVMPIMARNRRRGLTGCLVFGPELFFEVLEGPSQDVREKFTQIQCDPRHHEVTLLLDEPLQERRFARFGFRAVHCGAAQTMPALIDALGWGQPAATPGDRKGLFSLLRRVEPKLGTRGRLDTATRALIDELAERTLPTSA